MKLSSPHVWPAEWDPQAATWIAWPHNLETWPNRFDNVPRTFVRWIRELSQIQRVNVLTGPAGVTPSAEQQLRDLNNVVLHPIKTNDVWIRDYGPTFVRRRDDNSLVGVTWKYNAWGGKYPPYDDDAVAAPEICVEIGCPQSRSTMHCEGGAIDGNGAGLVMTTSSCLMNPNRNPGWPKSMVETELMLQLGCKKVLWIDGGDLAGDDTDGHIDQLARFISPDTILAATSSHPDDPNRNGLERNVQILRRATGVEEERLTVHVLPTPPPRFIDGQRVPESYCNFLFANGVVLVPTFRSEATDNAAVELLGHLLPQLRIIPLDAYDLAWGLGAFHCASQQQPKASAQPSPGNTRNRSTTLGK